MLMYIENTLSTIEAIRFPVVFIRPEVDKSLASRVREVVTNHQGELTEDEEEATHIIHSTVDPLPEEYARPSFRRDRHIMMHWYYFPESYDSWIPNTFDVPVSKFYNNNKKKLHNQTPRFTKHLLFNIRITPFRNALHLLVKKDGMLQQTGLWIWNSITSG